MREARDVHYGGDVHHGQQATRRGTAAGRVAECQVVTGDVTSGGAFVEEGRVGPDQQS
jgi:hypothetical protein